MKTTNDIRLTFYGPRDASGACRGARGAVCLVAFARRLAG